MVLAGLRRALPQQRRESERAGPGELGIGDDQVEHGMTLCALRERQADEPARRELGAHGVLGKPGIAQAHACGVNRRGLVGDRPAFLV